MTANDHFERMAHPEVARLLGDLAEALPRILETSLLACYLTGSLTYGDFDPGSSDIDYLVILDREITPEERIGLEALHADLFDRYPIWRERVEGSYVTRAMLASVLPPLEPRPYVNGGAFWNPDPRYGNEWLINLHAVREAGIALAGPEPCALIPPVRIEDVRAANRRDLFQERLPEIDLPGSLPDSHHEAYATLTLCRILHRESEDGVVSKRVAARWVIELYGDRWRSLVERALAWQHGEHLGARAEVIGFTRFVAGELARTGDMDVRT